MHDKQQFFMRDAWRYDPAAKAEPRADAGQGFATRALHAGFLALEEMERFRSFVPPITPSMTYPYKHFDEIPYPVYGRTLTPTTCTSSLALTRMKPGSPAFQAVRSTSRNDGR